MKNWYKKWFKDPFTVACDISPFRGPHNQREIAIHCKGYLDAHFIMLRWVDNHSWGQARILSGHLKWDN